MWNSFNLYHVCARHWTQATLSVIKPIIWIYSILFQTFGNYNYITCNCYHVVRVAFRLYHPRQPLHTALDYVHRPANLLNPSLFLVLFARLLVILFFLCVSSRIDGIVQTLSWTQLHNQLVAHLHAYHSFLLRRICSRTIIVICL